MASADDSQVVFDSLSFKFSNLLYGRKKGDQNLINKILDDFNSIDFRYTIVTNPTKAVLLVNNFCTLVPPEDSLIVGKCCKLITNLVNRQFVKIEGQTLTLVIQWCIQSLKLSANCDVLVTLEVLIRSNVQNLELFVNDVVISNGPVVFIAQDGSTPECSLLAVQCLEACTYPSDGVKREKSQEYTPKLKICSEIFVKYLTTERLPNFDQLVHKKILNSCLKGLQNIVMQSEEFLKAKLDLLLGIVKTYMVYGIKGVNYMVPQRIMPAAMSIPEPRNSFPVEKKGGKVTRQRKHKVPASVQKDGKRSEDWEEIGRYVPVSYSLAVGQSCVPNVIPNLNKLKTSDSDFSDTEGGRAAKINVTEGRVRQAALNLMLNICKALDKKTLFSYWSSFISDSSSLGSHYLSTCILKDPSPRGRLAALNALLAFLVTSKFYLFQAEMSEKSTSFIPFSVILGLTIQELHRCLCLALNENSVPVLTQVLKCLAALVQATPYHRLKGGLITKIVRNVKIFVTHKDTVVQIAALVVFGCLLASEPVVHEAIEAFLKSSLGHSVENNSTTQESKPANLTEDVDYVEFSSDEEEVVVSSPRTDMPWLLEKCLTKLNKTELQVPASVKLECLQVLSAMSRNYFETLVAPYINLVGKTLDLTLMDKCTDLRLHGGRTLDFLGQSMNLYFEKSVGDCSALESAVIFWQTLLGGSLISLLQDEEHPSLRAVGCDCLGSVGPHVFKRLPEDKQILAITFLFGCSRDVESSVKGAAVRALGIFVLYPSLIEDTGFILDAANEICRTVKEPNMSVRVKATWALGNLSEALVLNKSKSNGTDEISNIMLKLIIQDILRSVGDKGQVKMSSSVRALGNVLQLEVVKEPFFADEVKDAVNVLVKGATKGTNMKVRWNSCYALANALKNEYLYETGKSYIYTIFVALMNLVQDFYCNLKVRINAALALGSPPSQKLYGQWYMSVWRALLNALENSHNIEDVNEYKHRDQLIDQICLSLAHLTTLLTKYDLPTLEEKFLCRLDNLGRDMYRVMERVLPEKSGVICAAFGHVNELNSQDHKERHKEVLNMLLDIFGS